MPILGLLSPNTFRWVVLSCWLAPLVMISFCHCHDKIVEVVGTVQCSDCKGENIRTKHELSGFHIGIDCKITDGNFKTKAVGEIDEKGDFQVMLPSEIVKDDGELKEECFAQLHTSGSTPPCPTNDGIEYSKVIFKSSNSDGKLTFTPAGKLSFSAITCATEPLWPEKMSKKSHSWRDKRHLHKSLPIVFPPVHKKPHHPVHRKPLHPVSHPIRKPRPAYKTPTVPMFRRQPLPTPSPPSVPVYNPSPMVGTPVTSPPSSTKPCSPQVPSPPEYVPISEIPPNAYWPFPPYSSRP